MHRTDTVLMQVLSKRNAPQPLTLKEEFVLWHVQNMAFVVVILEPTYIPILTGNSMAGFVRDF